MAVFEFNGRIYEIPQQNPGYPHTYGWGQKTQVRVDIDYFCGGEADGWALWTVQLLSLRDTGWLMIQDYRWTPYIIGNDSEFPARVWESIYLHECSRKDWIPMPPQQITVIQQLWAEVDAAYYKFNNDNTMTREQTTHLQGYMRGICTSIRHLMNPRYASDDDIVVEVHRRHIKKRAGEDYVTPGVGEPLDMDRLMQPVTNGLARTRTAEPVEAKAPKHSLSDDVVQKIRAARANGIDDSDLCMLYGIKPSVLASL